MNHSRSRGINASRYALTSAVGAMLLFAAWAAGQNAIPPSARNQADTENYKLTVHSNLVFLPTRVQTKHGEAIFGLTPENLIVEDNGVRQSVQVDEDPDFMGVSLVVVLQCGRSAPSEFNKLKGLDAMIGGIVGDSPHEVAIVAYGERSYVLDDFSTRPDAIPLALSRLKPCGDYHAATIDAVSYAINMLNRRHNDYRHAILLIGEMRDYGSHAKLQDVAAELGVNDIVIYSVAFAPAKSELLRNLHGDDEGEPENSPFVPPTTASKSPPATGTSASSPAEPEPVYIESPPFLVLPPEIQLIINALKVNTASELASLSGGEYINFTTQRGFEDGLQRVSNHLHDYYLLSFKPSPTAHLALHTLRVRVADHPDAVIHTRKSYWPAIVEPVSGDGR